MSDKLDKLYNELSGLTVLEVAELVKLLEDKWGVSAAAAMPMMMAGPRRSCCRGRGEDGVRRHSHRRWRAEDQRH